MGETAHRRGAYPRGGPGEFKGLLRQGKLMGLMECRRVVHSPSRPLAHSPPGSAVGFFIFASIRGEFWLFLERDRVKP